MRIIGAVFIIVGFGVVGYIQSTAARESANMLWQFLAAQELMIRELEYRRTPLPELCTAVADATVGPVSSFFRQLKEALCQETLSSVYACGNAALAACNDIATPVKHYICMLLVTLGRFDIAGQVAEIQRISAQTKIAYDDAIMNLKLKDKSNRMLWLGLGVAVAIILV